MPTLPPPGAPASAFDVLSASVPEATRFVSVCLESIRLTLTFVLGEDPGSEEVSSVWRQIVAYAASSARKRVVAEAPDVWSLSEADLLEIYAALQTWSAVRLKKKLEGDSSVPEGADQIGGARLIVSRSGSARV